MKNYTNILLFNNNHKKGYLKVKNFTSPKKYNLINLFDYLLLIILIFVFVNDIINIIAHIVNHLFDLINLNYNDYIKYMVDTNTTSTTVNTTNTNTTTTQIIHNDGSWSNTIRSLFIYSTGAIRWNLVRNGTPGSKTFIVTGTVVLDALGKVLNNTINDPTYVKNHYLSWKSLWIDEQKGEARVELDQETSKILESNNNNFLGGGNNLSDLSNTIINSLFDKFKFILEPLQVNYSNEVLANQIHDISILLFLISVLITILLIFLLINIFLLLNMDKIIKYFKNKWVLMYLNWNKKMISIEVFLLGGSIIYFMFTLSNGILFIAKHPITF